MKTLSFCAVLLAFSAVGLSTRLLAQADRGAIKGEVQDSQKANIPAAKITLKEEAFHLSVFSGGGWSGSGDARFEGEYQSMRSAPCASAPSHPLHAMPSRITRNSYRPRASDRTMVATENTRPACRVFQTRWHRHHQQRKLTRMDNKSQTSSGKPNQSGAGSRENHLAPVEVEVFS